MLNHLTRHETKDQRRLKCCFFFVFFLICGVRCFLDNPWSKMEEDSLLNRTLHQHNAKPKFVFVTHWLTKICKSPRAMFPAQFLAQVPEPRAGFQLILLFGPISPFFLLPACSFSSQSDTDLARYKPQLIMEWDEKGTPVMLITLMNGRLARQQKGTTAALSRCLLLITNIKDFCLLDSQGNALKPVFYSWKNIYSTSKRPYP